jgi:predicted DCC family thiol-disulfide oxidoreductase YuxK
VTPTFVYDGDCSFCTTCAQFIERRIPTRARVIPWQFADLDSLGLTTDECEEAVQWVSDSARAAGPDAIALILKDAGRAWKFAGDALNFGPIRLAAWPAYRWVAGHRHLLPGGTAACSLPQAQRNLL